jgi:tripeptidyl-peptidase-1
VAWLRDNGVSSIRQPAVDLIDVDLSVAVAETLLATQFHEFVTDSKSGDADMVIRASSQYSLPEHIADKVLLVGNVLQLPAIQRCTRTPVIEMQGEATNGWPDACSGKCKGLVTPAIIKQRYNIPESDSDSSLATGSSSRSSNSTRVANMATAEFQGQGWETNDLDRFSKACKLKSNVSVHKEVLAPGSTHSGKSGLESMLDIEYIKGIGGGIPLTNIYSAKYSLLDWVKLLAGLGDTDLPLVHSVSYGTDESQQTGAAYMVAVNAQLMAMGARGVSILFASGDFGVWGRTGTGFGKFKPDFPSSSPYVTAVGGTDFKTKGVVGDEVAWDLSGGGFSNTFAAPAYQQAAIAQYKQVAARSLPDSSKWNATGRGCEFHCVVVLLLPVSFFLSPLVW